MKVAWLKILLLLIGFNVGLSAQNYHIERHLTVDDGLPSNETYSTFQTDDGDLWICTDRGLARYNGISMQVYDEEDGLADNVVFKSYKDYTGRIWLITAGGLSYLEGDSIISPGFNEELTSHRQYDYINDIYLDSSGVFLVTLAVPAGGYFSIGKDQEVSFVWLDQLPQSKCAEKSFFLVKGGKLLATGILNNYGGVCKNYSDTLAINKELEVVIVYRSEVDRGHNRNSTLVNIGGQISFFSIRNILYKLRKDSIELQYILEGEIIDIKEKKNNLYLATKNAGINILHEKKIVAKILEKKSVSSMDWMDQQRLLITTLKSGVYIVNTIIDQRYQLPENINIALMAKPILITKNKIQLYYNNNIHVLSLVENRIAKEERIKVVLDTSHGMFMNAFWDVKAKRTYFSGGYVEYDTDSQEARYIQLRERDAKYTMVQAIDTGRWVAYGRDGALIFDSDTVLWRSNIPNGQMNVRTTYVNQPNHIYFGCYEGLYEYHNGNLSRIGLGFEGLDVRIEDILTINKNIEVVATMGSGVVIRTKGRHTNITTKDGLLSNMVNEVEVYKDYILVGSNRGLNAIRYEIDSDGSVNFLDVSSILKDIYIDNIHIANEEIFVESGKDIYKIKDELDFGQERPILLLKECKVLGNHAEIDWTGSYDYENYENTITFQYRVNELLHPNLQQYEYRLLGIDSSWKRTDERQLTFENLSPGNYRLEMKARNSYGQWSDEPQWLEFEIRPHFTQTGWFRYGGSAATAFLLGGIVFVYVRNRHRKLARENFLLNSALNSLKLEMNPHFIFNALNSIQYFIANNQRREANMFLARFATLIRNVLNATDQKKLSLREEVSKLRDYLELERIRMHRHFSHKITFTNDFDHDKTYLPPMLIQPLIENAIWHGVSELDRPGEILVKFNLAKGILSVVVEDNGKGMDKTVEVSLKKKSRGLRNIESRLELMSQIERKPYSMSIDSEPGKGTRVELKIPQ